MEILINLQENEWANIANILNDIYKVTKLVMQVMNMICYIYLYVIITLKIQQPFKNDF